MKLRWKIAQAAEIRWWQSYLNKKDKGEYLDWKKKYWRQFLEDCNMEVPTGASCADIGCGPAGIFTVLEEQQVMAVDPLLEQYEAKLAHFNPADYPKVSFQTLPLEQLVNAQFVNAQFENAQFDYVFCLNAINHVADLDACLDNLIKIIKKDGTLVLSIDAHNHQVLKHIFRALPGDILHPHQYDLAEYQTMLTSRGLSIEATIHKDKAFFFDYFVLIAKLR